MKKNNNDIPLVNYFEEKNKQADIKRKEITSYFEFIREFFDLKDTDREKLAITDVLKKINEDPKRAVDLLSDLHVLLNISNKNFFNVVIREYKSNVNYVYRLLYDIDKSIKEGKSKEEVTKLRNEMISFLKADHEREYDEIISKKSEFIGYDEYKKVMESLYGNYIRHYRLKYEENELRDYLKDITKIKKGLSVFDETKNENPFDNSLRSMFKEVRKYISGGEYNIDSYDFQGNDADVKQHKKKTTTHLLENFNKN